MLDGKWEVQHGSYDMNRTLLKAKQHCSKEGKCFGIKVKADYSSTFFYSINFPIQLIQNQQGKYYIHKKENGLGNMFDHGSLFI